MTGSLIRCAPQSQRHHIVSVAWRSACLLMIAMGLAGCLSGKDGAAGANGTNGTNGANGTNGSNGASGTNGLNALVTMTAEPAGVNCAGGGVRFDVGIDSNRNSTLDAGEITQTGYACNGADGAAGAGGGGWQVATLVELDAAGDAYAPQVVLDGNGNALAVWYQSDGAVLNIWANRFVAATGWGNPELIETDDSGDAVDPRIAMDANGDAVVVWQQSDGTRNNIWANRFTTASGWDVAELIEADDAGDATDPRVAVDSSGNAVAVWQHDDGTRFNIRANRYAAGAGWGADQLIETDNAGAATRAAVASDGSGNAVAVWQQSDGTRTNLWANRYTPGGGWAGATLIENDNVGHARTPAIALDVDGNAIAVWEQHDGTRYNIQSNRYVAGSGWAGAELIETSNAGTARDAVVAMDGDGNAIAVWEQTDGTRYNVVANRYSVSGGWGTAQLIETDNSGGARDPAIGFDASMNAIVVWSSLDDTRDNIWSNRYVAGSGWGNAQLVETDNTGDAGAPAVAVNAGGEAFAAWQHFDGALYNIWSNRFIP